MTLQPCKVWLAAGTVLTTGKTPCILEKDAWVQIVHYTEGADWLKVWVSGDTYVVRYKDVKRNKCDIKLQRPDWFTLRQNIR